MLELKVQRKSRLKKIEKYCKKLGRKEDFQAISVIPDMLYTYIGCPNLYGSKCISELFFMFLRKYISLKTPSGT